MPLGVQVQRQCNKEGFRLSVIELNQLTKYYGTVKGVENLNLAVERGEIFGFIGPNGAGKSTTIRVLMQLIFPTAGSFSIFGTKIAGDMPEIRRRIGFLPSEVNYYYGLSGRQLLQFSAAAYGVRNPVKMIENYAERLDLNLEKSIKSYSLGNRKKLAIIQCLLHEPELLILDEPTSGLDPLMQTRFFEIVKEKSNQGMTVFLSSHVLSEVEKHCDRVGFIRDGQLIHLSDIGDVPGRETVFIEVRFSEDGNLIEKYGFTDIDPQVIYEDGVHVFHARGLLHNELHKISERPISDISVRKPTLEEVFMDLYEQEEKVVQ
ncbi:MAG TPA: ABC transporter ATP-binding protein [Firmicutes bacterium]|jgi:ABC-2 type transport system ATP-binding protein|nr:ABC transporter ATP-binding protein [Bacillota bacterium]HCM16852.1 ABC transporter ATP-binding protein [Bacillota bacterium]HCT36966.1 ABC transporter ATP-binding protein [Bacillota bacterium]